MNQHSRSSEAGNSEVTAPTGKVTIGLDAADRYTRYCVLEGTAEKAKCRGRVRTRKQDLQQFLERYEAAVVGLETGVHCQWMRDVIEACGHEAVVANARELRAIYESDNKNE